MRAAPGPDAKRLARRLSGNARYAASVKVRNQRLDFSLDSTLAGLAMDARIGGSPFNVAVGLARLGQPVSFFGAVGRGFLGEDGAGAQQRSGGDDDECDGAEHERCVR